MATWEMGLFSNDGAADLLGSLDDAEPAVASALLGALTAAATNDGYLEVDEGQAAVATAAIVAAQRPGGPRLDPSTVPAFLADGSGLDLPDADAESASKRGGGDQSMWRTALPPMRRCRRASNAGAGSRHEPSSSTWPSSLPSAISLHRRARSLAPECAASSSKRLSV